MKANLFFITIVFAFSMTPFNSYSNGEASEDGKLTGLLYVTGSHNIRTDEYGMGKLNPPEELVFTGDDILSYNLSTKEIVFVDSIFNKLSKNYSNPYFIFNIYFNDTLLLGNIAHILPVMSWLGNDLVLELTSNGYNLDFIYNSLNGIPEAMKEPIYEAWRVQREARKEGLEIFIDYLSDRNKIITGKEEIKTELPIQIYSSGKTIHVNNQTGKNAVVTVYRIDGVKVKEQTVAYQTTILEMPVKGFYLVLVKAENEKAVTAKIIVR